MRVRRCGCVTSVASYLVDNYSQKTLWHVLQSKWYPYPVPATQNFNTWAEPTHRSFIRKAGSDFGWDWGPAFATTGMAGSAYIELGASTPELRDLAVEQRFPHTNLSVAHVTVRVAIDTKGASHDNVTFSLLIDGTLRASTTAHVGSSSDDTDEIALQYVSRASIVPVALG